MTRDLNQIKCGKAVVSCDREGSWNAVFLVNYGEKPLSCPIGSCEDSSEKIALQ